MDTVVLLRNEGHVETLQVCGNDVCNSNPPTTHDEISCTHNPARKTANSMYRVTSIPLETYCATAQRRIKMQDNRGGSDTMPCWRRFCFSHWAVII
jgi:hypothetical protein